MCCYIYFVGVGNDPSNPISSCSELVIPGRTIDEYYYAKMGNGMKLKVHCNENIVNNGMNSISFKYF